MNHVSRYLAGAALASILCLGCGEPLKDGQRIEEPRVLGVRIEGEEGSSQVAPGEALEVDLLVAGSSGPVNAEIAFRVCEGIMTDRGVPECSAAPFIEGSALATDFPFLGEVPAGVPEGARLVVLGVACADSEPNLAQDPLSWSCSEEEDPPLRFSFETSVAIGSDRNENPDLSQVEVELSGVAVSLDDIDETPSCDPDAAAAEAEETHDLQIDLGPLAIESGEELQVSLFSTEGKIERQFTFLDDEQPSFSLEFEAGAADVAVKHYLVARDSRGGVSWVSWSFCQR